VRFVLSSSLVAISCIVLLAGCDCAGPPPRHTACTTSADCEDGQSCVDRTCRAPTDGGGLDANADGGGGPPDAFFASLTGIHVEPPSASLTASDGAMPTVDFEVIGDYDDGHSAPLGAGFWIADAPVLGAIDRSTGVYTAAGIVAGTSTVTVDGAGFMATATVTVRIERTILDTGAPSDAASHFGGTATVDPARAANVLYPLEGTVFPQNVFPADIQWDNGNAGDLYQVRVELADVSIRAYVIHSGGGFGYHYFPSREAWRALAESDAETDVTLTIDRWDAAADAVISGTPRHFRFAAATIRGSIYYWDLGGGRIFRIGGDGTGLSAFMPNPPRSGTGAQCVACHAISRDGRRMAAELWEGGGTSAIFDLTGDTTADPPPMIVAPGVVSFLTASFDPSAGRLVGSVGNELFLIDGNTGARLAAGGAGLPSAQSAHPTWSPDGNAIAYVSNTDGGWAVDFTRGDLSIIDVVAPDTFAAPRTIFTGSPLVVARPSWSPDSSWIAFQHGQHSRAYQDFGGGHTELRDATIRMTSRDGATVFDLEHLNAGEVHAYYPTFSPFDEGGYFWLAFFSTRDYGNAQVGTRGTARRQLWVAAIDSTPTGGVDPSFAPYWLPQQEVTHQNMAAFWTEEACRGDGLTCATSGECCSGFCRDTGSGPVCVPPDIVECSHDGEGCLTDGDCCAEDHTTCMSNVCGSLG
jgi:hypothetical protein